MLPRYAEFRQLAIENTLRSCWLFAGLPAVDISAVAAFTISKNLAKGEYLFHEGARSEGFYIVQTGSINLHHVSALGKEHTIHLFRPVESFAEWTLVTEAGYLAHARAAEATTVLFMPKPKFVELLGHRSEIALRVLQSVSRYLEKFIGLLDDLVLKDVEARIAGWLLKRCPQPLSNAPAVIKLNRTKRVLAAEMGTTTETLSRSLAKFRKQKHLRMKRNMITVAKPRELEKLLQKRLGEL
jgi:CRP/FNR family transcriptional regulator, dissimilatory nitrate respiration regulator